MILNKFKTILTKEQKKSIRYLIFMVIISMGLEISSLGIIVPIFTIITNRKLEDERFDILNNLIASIQYDSLVTICMTLLVIIFLIKTIYSIFLVRKQSYFAAKLNKDLSVHFFNGYIESDFEFHQKTNSSTLIRNIQNEITIFTTLSQSLLYIFSEVAIIIGIGVLLIVTEPIGAITTFSLLAILIFIFFRVLKKKVSKLGCERQELSADSFKLLTESLNGIKDITVYSNQNFFKDRFEKVNQNLEKVNTQIGIFDQLPKYLLELISISSLSVLTIVLVNLNYSVTEIIPTLGVFIAAAFRMIPSINKMIYSIQRINFTLPVINLLAEEITLFNKIQKKKHSNLIFNQNLKLKDITFKYTGSQNPVLNKVNLKINKGNFIGIIGESGSGKSTLVDLLLGLHIPQNGQIILDNKALNLKSEKLNTIVSYIPQSISLQDDTIAANIAFGIEKESVDLDKVKKCTYLANLENLIHRLPYGLETNIGESGAILSGGQRQRIGIARALYFDREILILDEATSALDEETESEVMKALLNLKGLKTLIVISHKHSILKGCDRLFEMKNNCLYDVSDKIPN